jgi:hypothetical protein
VKELENAIQTYVATANDDPKPFKWTKTADDIIEKIARFAGRTLAAHRGGETIKETTDPGD